MSEASINLAELEGQRKTLRNLQEYIDSAHNEILQAVKQAIEQKIPEINESLAQQNVPYKLREHIYVERKSCWLGSTFYIYPDFVGETSREYYRLDRLCDIINDLPTVKNLSSQFSFRLTIIGGIGQFVVDGKGLSLSMGK